MDTTDDEERLILEAMKVYQAEHNIGYDLKGEQWVTVQDGRVREAHKKATGSPMILPGTPDDLQVWPAEKRKEAHNFLDNFHALGYRKRGSASISLIRVVQFADRAVVHVDLGAHPNNWKLLGVWGDVCHFMEGRDPDNENRFDYMIEFKEERDDGEEEKTASTTDG